MTDKKILDVRAPKEEQDNSESLLHAIAQKKWQVDFEENGKVRFAYTDDPQVVEDYLKSKGFKILKVQKI